MNYQELKNSSLIVLSSLEKILQQEQLFRITAGNRFRCFLILPYLLKKMQIKKTRLMPRTPLPLRLEANESLQRLTFFHPQKLHRPKRQSADPDDPKGSFSHRSEGIAWRGDKAHKIIKGQRATGSHQVLPGGCGGVKETWRATSRRRRRLPSRSYAGGKY